MKAVRSILMMLAAAILLPGCHGQSGEIRDAAWNGDLEKVKAIIAVDPESVNAPDKDGLTPLHWAAEKGNLEIVRFLIDKGAEVSARTDQGFTPLHSAAFKGRREVVQLLIASGADLNARSGGGETPLKLAKKGGRDDTADILREHGAVE